MGFPNGGERPLLVSLLQHPNSGQLPKKLEDIFTSNSMNQEFIQSKKDGPRWFWLAHRTGINRFRFDSETRCSGFGGRKVQDRGLLVVQGVSCRGGERAVRWEELGVNEADETRQRRERRVSRLILAAWSPGPGMSPAGRVSLRLALQSTRGRRTKPDLRPDSHTGLNVLTGEENVMLDETVTGEEEQKITVCLFK